MVTNRFRPKLKGIGKKKKVVDPKTGKLLPGKWREEIAFQTYDLLKAGHSYAQVIQILGYRECTMRKWAKTIPLMKIAIQLAKSQRPEEGSITDQDYIYQSLPDELKAIWNEIIKIDHSEEGSATKLELLMNKRGKRGKQHIWIHAFVHFNFNRSKACKITQVTPGQLNGWMKEPEFCQLLDHITGIKKDFVEGKLFDLIEAGETSAVLFANRTLNRDRGYGDSKSIQINQTTTVRNLIDIDTLNLSLEVRKAILEAVRAQEGGMQGTMKAGPPPMLPQVRTPIDDLEATVINDVIDEEVKAMETTPSPIERILIPNDTPNP